MSARSERDQLPSKTLMNDPEKLDAPSERRSRQIVTNGDLNQRRKGKFKSYPYMALAT